IALKIKGGRLEQELKGHLQDLLNPYNQSNVTKKYILSVTLNKKIEAVGIQPDRDATRYNVVIIANYKLRHIENNKIIDDASMKIIGSYDAVDSEYSTFIADRNTSNRIMQELANDIKSRIITNVKFNEL
ncbi:MAG: LPS assembly lipoprotein LptE, partial [Pseudomonadota bacterium]